MPREADRRALELARRQHGVITRRQLMDCGYRPRTLSRRVADGAWLPLMPGVLRLPGTPLSLATRSRAAALVVPGGVLTGVSVAAIRAGPWDGVGLGLEPWLIAGRKRGLDVTFVTHPGARWQLTQGMAIAAPASAVVDLVRFLPRTSGDRVGYRALQSGTVTLPFLEASARRLVRCSGVPRLREFIATARSGARSEAERRFVELVARAGIPGLRVNYPVQLGNGRRAVLDGAFPSARLAVEIDGLAYHTGVDQHQRDVARQNELVLLGWEVLRFTWIDLAERPDEVVAMLRAALGRLRG